MMSTEVETRYMRPRKAACAEAVLEGYADRSGRLSVRRLSGIALRGMGQQAGIAPDTGRLIDDCDFYSDIVAPTAEMRHIAGKCLYAGFLRNSWGHFLMNSTARLWPLFGAEAGQYDHIVFFAEDTRTDELRGNFREFCELAGLADRLIILPAGSSCSFDYIDAPEIALELDRYVAAEFLRPFEAVRRAALADAQQSEALCPGIILTRSGWNGNRQMQRNIDYIESIFIDAGYLPIAPESTSLTELIRLMERAPQVVSFCGTTAHNILFSPARTLITAERAAAPNSYQLAITRLTGYLTIPVDCFRQPLLVSSTDNLTIYARTPELEHFAADFGLTLPPYRENPAADFRAYLRFYRRHYGYAPGLNEWEEGSLPAIAEAYFCSRPYYEPFLSRRRPTLLADYLSPRVWWKGIKEYLRHN